MEVYALLLFLIGCWGIQWKAMNDFKNSFEGYSIASGNTISHIQNILDTSKTDSELFFNNTYSNNPVLKRISRMRSSSDKCFARLIDEDDLKFLFENQIYQLQIPLRRRLVEVRERINKINSSIDIYERIAGTIFWGCKSLSGNCFEETNEWLRSTIYSLSCAIHPNCQIINNHTNHSIRKRTICHPRQFSCEYGKCITGNFFCDGECDCADCSDEPNDCVKDCTGFRCSETYRCISNSKMCDGNDDCGDGTDEEECRPDHTPSNKLSYRMKDCSINEGKFLCTNTKCIVQQKLCDGHDDCGDWSDEGVHCKVGKCSPECSRKGGVCVAVPRGSECVYECPPETYETSRGCKLTPDAPFTTLVQFLEDTPRLTTRYGARLKFLKSKTIKMINKSLENVMKCKRQRFTLLFSSIDNPNENIDTEGSGSSNEPIKTRKNKIKLPSDFVDDGNMPGRLSDEYGNDKINAQTRPATNSKTAPTFGTTKLLIDDQSMPGRISDEYGNDKSNAQTRPATNSKTPPTFETTKLLVDDQSMPGRISGESENDKDKTKTKPSTDTKTTPGNQAPKQVLNQDTKIVSDEFKNDNHKAKPNIKTTPVNHPTQQMVSDENIPGRDSGQFGKDKTNERTTPKKSKTEKSMNTNRTTADALSKTNPPYTQSKPTSKNIQSNTKPMNTQSKSTPTDSQWITYTMSTEFETIPTDGETAIINNDKQSSAKPTNAQTKQSWNWETTERAHRNQNKRRGCRIRQRKYRIRQKV